MFVFVVLDPKTLEPNNVLKSDYSVQLLQFVRAASENVMFPVDEKNRLRNQYLDSVEKIGSIPKRGQQIALIITEIIKQGKHKLPKYGAKFNGTSQCLIRLKAASYSDAIVTTGQEAVNLVGHDPVAVEDYDISLFEERRKKLLDCVEPLDETNPSAVADHFIRICAHSDEVTLIDKYIGKISNVKKFGDGLAFIMDAWQASLKKYGGGSIKKVTFTIITAASDVPDGKSADADRRILDVVRRNESSLRTHIAERLIAAGKGLHVTVKIFQKIDKSDRPLLHDRFIATQGRVCGLTRGFDIFRGENQMHRQWMYRKGQMTEHIDDCANLPDAVPPIVVTGFSNNLRRGGSAR